jgi:hypothetical protein
MTVVINEFEVITGPSAPAGGGNGGGAAAGGNGGSSSGPTPLDVARVIRREAERQARLRAN